MIILSANFANADRSVVEIRTVEAGAVLVYLNGPDISGGWRNVYSSWARSNETAAYVAPVVRCSVSEHLASFGFDAIAVVDLFDAEVKFAAQGLPLPPKCAAIRPWINASQAAYASGQTLPDPPCTLPEILAEISPLLQP